MDRDSTPMMTAPPPAILGRFLQVARKTGEIVQEFPIDGERMTIGREPEHNIRLYFQDISKLHAEIVFDLDTGKASLHVHGSNGLDHAPLDGPFTHLKPPAIVPLNDKDRIIMRKRLFQFEYATEAQRTLANFSPMTAHQVLLGSPAVPQIAASPARFASPMVRRRASKRMSLIPKGKTFVPLTPAKRRHSTLSGDLPDSAAISRSAIKRTALAPASMVNQEEAHEVEVEVVEGENGDMVYLENHDEEEEEVPADFSEEAPSPTPARAPETPSKVPTKVAMASPRGAYSMHKALLVRSARKAWQETRSPSIEDAIEDGMVQTRRKSSSPRASPRGRSTEANDLSMDDQEGSDRAEERHDDLALDSDEPNEQQDGSEAAHAHREGDSDGDSFEADLSLDFGAADATSEAEMDHDMPAEADPADSAASEDQHDEGREEEEVDMEAEDSGSAADEQPAYGTPVMSKLLSRFYTPQVKRPANGPRPSLAAIGGGPARRSSLAVPATPPAQFVVGAATPRSGMMGKPSRRIIAASAAVEEPEAEEKVVVEVKTVQTPHKSQRDAAAWEETKRRRQSLATPRPLPLPDAAIFRTPLVAAARPLSTPLHPALAPSSPDFGETESPTAAVPVTPGNAFRARLEAAGQQSAARPAPTSAVKARSLFDTEPNRQGRRATVGFALPSTPARRDDGPSSSLTVAKPTTRFAPPTPRFAKPTQEDPMEAIEEDEQSLSPAPRTPVSTLFNTREAAQVSTPPVYPSLPTVSMHQVTPQRQGQQQPPTPASQDEAGVGDVSTSFFGTSNQIDAPVLEQHESMPSTPVYAGLNHLFSAKPAPKTPYMNDIRNLYPSLPEPAKTPSFAGMKTLFAEPAPAPATPLFQGMREMFRQPTSTLPPQTPGMDGLAEMFPEEDDPLAMGSEDEVLGRGESVRSDFGDEDEDEEMLDSGNTSTIIAVSVPVEEEEVAAPRKAIAAKSSIPTLKAPTRAKSTIADKAKDASTATKPAARGRKAAAASATAEDATKPTTKAPSAKTTSRSTTASRTAKSAASKAQASAESSTTATKIPEPPKARTARAKKVLEESVEQETDTAAVEDTSKPTRAKRPAAGTATTRTRKTAAPASTAGTEEPKTAPAKRARGAAASSAEKENDAPEEVQPATKTKRAAASSSAAAVKKAPAARTRKATEEPVVAAPSAPAVRVTRSRK